MARHRQPFRLASLLWLAAHVGSAQGTGTPKPLSVPASQFWDGKDGPWSTFQIEVGTPPQQARVLPGSDKSATWLVDSELCKGNRTLEEYDSCSNARGYVFRRANSSTWVDGGEYELDTYLEQRVGLSAGAVYGNDTITLGWGRDNAPALANQTIATYIADDFALGSLSLSPYPTNFTNYNAPVNSLLQSLRNMTDPIPSLSWSYTAGAYNLAPKVYGSLTLGGYDKARFEPNNVTFPFGDDQSLQLQVGIQGIKTNLTQDSLLGSGIVAYISTLVADIWLPTAACEKFEKAFGLVWDNKTQLYLLDDYLHQSLLLKNPLVQFQVGPQTTGESVTLNLPYWNFYHTATKDLGASGLYFPLKRAANDTQYVLGRSFLQSVYLSVDYERNSFNLSQAKFPSTASSEITAILPPLQETTPGSGATGAEPKKPALPTAAIVGIAIGGAAVVIALGAGAFLYRRRKARAKMPHELDADKPWHGPAQEVDGDGVKHEVGAGLVHEFPGDMDPKVELAATSEKPAEADGVGRAIYEMPGDDVKLAEMPGEDVHVAEVPADSTHSMPVAVSPLTPQHEEMQRPGLGG